MSSQSLFQVEWTDVALADLEELLDFIAQENPAAADAVLTRLQQAAQRLERQSSSCGPGASSIAWAGGASGCWLSWTAAEISRPCC